MPKTKNAFAFRGYDEQRILSRPYFREFRAAHHVDENLSDEQIVSSFSAGDGDSVEVIQVKIEKCKSAMEQLAFYINHINRHEARLECYERTLAKEIATNENADLATLRARYKRVAELIDKYLSYGTKSPIANLTFEDIPRCINELDEKLKSYYRRRFAARLKQARHENHLTQQKLAERIYMSQNGYAQYETAKIEPSLPTLIKISQELNRPTDWLLGLVP